MNEILSDFHFVRPFWFLGLLPILLIWLLYKSQNKGSGGWRGVIDPVLANYLIDRGEVASGFKKRMQFLLWLTAWVLACTALAGPAWEKLPEPVAKKTSALIIVLDLSPSMLAQDIKPSRILRARYKLIDILKLRKEGLTALVVYAGSAHLVSPLTDDSKTIINLVNSLDPTMMPTLGSNIEEAIEISTEITANSGLSRADILLVTDGVDRRAFSTIETIVNINGLFRVSILGIGTEQGAPIPLSYGGFLKDQRGNILIPKLEPESLKKLAEKTGGVYQSMASDNNDINLLLKHTLISMPNEIRETERSFDVWNDQGYWLIIILLPLIILAFQRGVLVAFLLMPFLYPFSINAFEWNDLWERKDQQAAKALESGNAKEAQGLFRDDQWRASAAYIAGDYQSAVEEFGALSKNADADTLYNLANSLANIGEFEAAIDTYARSLEIAPNSEDALFNKRLLEDLLEQQQQQDQQQQQQRDQQQQQQQQQGQSDNKSEKNNSPPTDPISEGSEETDRENKDQRDEGERSQEQAKTMKDELNQAEESTEARQAQQELEQLLRSIPDDPGGLLRAKFRYQEELRRRQPKRPMPPNNEQSQRY
jgi:Ca-activated chloride channel family protein